MGAVIFICFILGFFLLAVVSPSLQQGQEQEQNFTENDFLQIHHFLVSIYNARNRNFSLVKANKWIKYLDEAKLQYETFTDKMDYTHWCNKLLSLLSYDDREYILNKLKGG